MPGLSLSQTPSLSLSLSRSLSLSLSPSLSTSLCLSFFLSFYLCLSSLLSVSVTSQVVLDIIHYDSWILIPHAVVSALLHASLSESLTVPFRLATSVRVAVGRFLGMFLSRTVEEHVRLCETSFQLWVFCTDQLNADFLDSLYSCKFKDGSLLYSMIPGSFGDGFLSR